MLRTLTRSVLLVAIFSCLALQACVGPPSTDGDETARLLASLASDDEAQRNTAVAALARCGAAAVTPLVDLLAGENRTAAAGARAAIQLLAHNAAAPASGDAASPARNKTERSRVARALLAEVENHSRPLDVRRRLLRLVGFTALRDAVPGLASLLADRDLGDMALHALAQIPGKRAHEALRDALDAGPREIRAAVILALGFRRDGADAKAILPFVHDDDRAVRLAAIGALGAIPDARSERVLWSVASAETGGDAAPARAAYVALAHSLLDAGGREEATVLFDRIYLDTEDPHFQCAGLLGLVKARPEKAIPLLLGAIDQDPEEVAGAAVQELARLPGEKITLAMAEAVNLAGNRSRVRLIHALGQRRDGASAAATARVVSFLKTAPDDAKVAVLDALAEREDPALTPHFRDATRSECEEVVIAAVGALGRLRDPAVLVDIIPFLDSNRDRLRKTAARAVAPLAIRLADETEGAGMEEERKRAIGLLEKVVALSDHTENVRDAVLKLRAFGIDADLPVPAGFVKHFRVVGPFRGRERMLGTDLFPTGMPVDCDGTVHDGDKTYRWKYFPPENTNGMLDFLRAVAPANDVGAYAYTEVTVADACDVVFRIGSDDDVFCWLNEKNVHSFEGGRGWAPDQDRVKVRLEKGTNRILFKVLNGGGGWALSLRITDNDGSPLKFTEPKP